MLDIIIFGYTNNFAARQSCKHVDSLALIISYMTVFIVDSRMWN